MMHKTERARIHAARPLPSQRFLAGIDHTLAHLPPREQKKPLYTKPWALPLTAALVLALALGGPPVVRAAVPFFQRLFSHEAEKIEQQQALPEAVRVSEQVAMQEQFVRTHPVDQAAQVGGMSVRIAEFWMVSEEDGPARGAARLRLAFPDAPEGFDPAKIDFTLITGGKTLAMLPDEPRERYLTTGRKDGDGEGWGNVIYGEDDVLECYMAFPYDNWDTQQITDFTVAAQFPEGLFSLAFTYDPVQAHITAQQGAQQNLAQADAFQQERLAELRQIAASAVPIGASVTVDGITLGIQEMSVVDDEAIFSIAVSGLRNQKNAKHNALDIGNRDFCIDGWLAPVGGGMDNWAMTDGVLTYIEKVKLPLARQAFQATSVIRFTGTRFMGEGKDTLLFPVVFRYEWATGKVTLPADTAEGDAWVREAEQRKRVPNMQQDAVFALDIPITRDGRTIALNSVTFRSNGELALAFTLDAAFVIAGGEDVLVLALSDQANPGLTRRIDVQGQQLTAIVDMTEMYPTLPHQLNLRILIDVEDLEDGDRYDFSIVLDRTTMTGRLAAK